ncbi:ABC transporter substrate-binding protein [Thermococcus eurythermalis]|uniref:ABC transporter substrate-binding protein n=1 Tax=Thermococcus eurythermalis TaxID=1505907 RepID=A0A097QVC5_9EURY|nr:BMP family ABC transporter substrate-binding protein [Thermococcus eurythermalis]AIU70425.1 ABC transporter substrate-binding protein [Thermococcus eurythermalis]
MRRLLALFLIGVMAFSVVASGCISGGEEKTGINILYTYTGSFGDPAKGKQATQAQLQQGAWVVYQVAGGTGLGVFEAIGDYLKANNKKMGPPFAIGVDSAQDWIKPGAIIASMMKRVDLGVYNAVKQAEENKFVGGVVELGLKEGGVKLSDIEDVKAMFDSLPEDIKQKKLSELGFKSEDGLIKFLEQTRKQVPDWIWGAVDELQNQIVNGQIVVPKATAKDQIEALRKAEDWKTMEEYAKNWSANEPAPETHFDEKLNQRQNTKKIAVVYDVGGRGDLSFNDMAYLGAKRAADEFGLEVTEVQSNSENDYLPNLRSLAKSGEYDIIVAVGYMMTEPVKQVAQEYPNQRFVIIDGFDPEMPKNVQMVLFKENEGSALAGALAALIALNDGKDTIGIVLGMEIPVLYKFEGGYRFGAYWALDYYQNHKQ